MSKEAVNLHIMGELGGKALAGYGHLAGVVPGAPSVSRQSIAAIDGVTKGVNDCSTPGHRLAYFATGYYCRRI